MKFSSRLLITAVLVAVVMFGVLAPTVHAQSAGGRIRLVHAIPEAPSVDITIDGTLSANDLEYAHATRHITIAPGEHTVTVTAGSGTLIESKVTVNPTEAITVVIEGTSAKPEITTVIHDLAPTGTGKARLSTIHVMADAPAVDIAYSNGDPLFQGVKYNEPSGEIDVPATATTLAVMPAGSEVSAAIVSAENIALVAGTHNTLLALGTVGGSVKPSYLLLTTPTDAEQPASNAFVRFAHTASGGDPVDIYIGDQLFVPSLAFGQATPHIAIDPKGAITVRAAGSSDDLLTVPDLGLVGGAAATIAFVASTGDELTTVVAQDNNSVLDPKTARLNLINATGSGNATFKLGSQSLVSDAAKGNDVPAAIYDVTVTVDDPAISLTKTLALDGGVLYDIIVVGDAANSDLIVAATSLNEQPGSAAGAEPVAVAEANPTEEPVAVEPTVEPTAAEVVEAPTTEPATETPVAEPPTEAPANPDVVTSDVVPAQDVTLPAPEITAPPPVSDKIIATVFNMNEGVNLKIREYPRADARTLGLVPRDTVLAVNGIKGNPAPTGLPTATATAGPTPTVSTEGVDPNALWINVTWQTPDGGTVTGWASSQYLHFTRKGKEIKDIAEILILRKIPEDTPGEINASVTPVAESTDVIGTVNVNEGTNLQMRRTPGIDGESLTLLPAGAQVLIISKTEVASQGGLVGEPENIVWLWSRFQSDSGSVVGWVNAQYIIITRAGRKWDIKDIPVAKEVERGFIEGNAPVVKAPPAEGLIANVDQLNPGANLQLRRDPNAGAESLGLIPAGAQLSILGRNSDGNWLQVDFNGITGWINSQYVSITENGRKREIADIKIVTGESDIIGTITPGPSPTPTVVATTS